MNHPESVDVQRGASGQPDAHVRVTLHVGYCSNGADVAEIAAALQKRLDGAVGRGLLTDGSPATVDNFAISVRTLPASAASIDEPTIASWLQARVDSGSLNLEELIAMAARYALAEPDSMREEFAERLAAQQDDALPSEQLQPPVSARAWSDDRTVESAFNAAAWFAQASDEAILELQEIGWSGDSASDDVAEYMSARDPEVRAVFTFLSGLPRTVSMGFECRVDEASALEWLRVHRAGLWARVLCAKHGVRLVQAQEPEIHGRWDWLDAAGNASDCSLETQEQAARDAVEKLQLDAQSPAAEPA